MTAQPAQAAFGTVARSPVAIVETQRVNAVLTCAAHEVWSVRIRLFLAHFVSASTGFLSVVRTPWRALILARTGQTQTD